MTRLFCASVSPSWGDGVSFRTKAISRGCVPPTLERGWIARGIWSPSPETPLGHCLGAATRALARKEILIYGPWFWRDFVAEAINLCILNLFYFSSLSAYSAVSSVCLISLQAVEGEWVSP